MYVLKSNPNNKLSRVKDFIVNNLPNAIDVKSHEIKSQNQKVDLLYVKSVINQDDLQNKIIIPFYEMECLEAYEYYLQSLDAYVPFDNQEETLLKLVKGAVVLFTESNIHILELKEYANKNLYEASLETALQGPRLVLSEHLETNLNLLRHRYNESALTIEKGQIGKTSKLDYYLLFDQQKTNRTILNQFKKQMDEIKDKKEIIQSVGEIQELLRKRKRTLFPTFMITERPDRIALNISQGKIVILLEGSPFALIAPATFYDFMSAMDDGYQSYWVSKFLKSLRYVGLLINLLLPAAYVGLTSFNPEIFRVQLALSIAGSRVGVPYPSFLEVLFMLIMMEMLTEASTRLPKTIGPAATTVGGLILGQAAVDAGLISNIMIIVVAAVAISNFVIPINQMGFAMRVVKYGLLILTIIYGMVGLVVSLLFLIIYLVRLDSLGKPYLKLFFGESSK